MTIDLFDNLRTALAQVISEDAGDSPHTVAFAGRLFGPKRLAEIAPGIAPFVDILGDAARYGGFPAVASLGFGLGSGWFDPCGAAEPFIEGLRRLKLRSENGVIAFAADDIALLGLAEGLQSSGVVADPAHRELASWLLDVINRSPYPGHAGSRVRSLAGDLLDRRGRLRVQVDLTDGDAVAMELALQATWPDHFVGVKPVDDKQRREWLRQCLHGSRLGAGALDQAVTTLRALDVIVDGACIVAVPSVPETARVLAAVQHSLKRWKWEDRSGRRDTAPAHWLIDDEYDVQSLLWAVLYPIYQTDLQDEIFLPHWGNVQPRADLAIKSLKLIIEVKIARQPSDFKQIEEAGIEQMLNPPFRLRKQSSPMNS